MPIKVNIDSITLDILSARLKHLVNPMDILKWLDNFKEDELDIALGLLKNFTVYTSNEIEEIFHIGLNTIRRATHPQNKIAIHPLGSFGKSGSMMAYLLRKTNMYINNPGIFQLCSSVSELESLPLDFTTLVIIDDFVGSGKSVLDYWNEKITPCTKAFSSYKFLGIAGMEFGVSKIDGLFDEVVIPESNIFKKAFSSDASYFGYRNHTAYRELAYKYGSQLTRAERLKSGKMKYSHALGFSNSQGMVGFFYGSPNNSLPIFWQGKDDSPTWHPLIPRFNHHKISQAKEFRKKISFELSLFKEYGSDNLKSVFATFSVQRGKKHFTSVNHIDFSLYAILKLKRKGNSEFSICQKLGITQADYLYYVNHGKKNGIFTKKNEISILGLELFKDAKKCIDNNYKALYENKKSYEVKDITYVPKTFNGKS